MANRKHLSLYDRIHIQFEIEHNPKANLSSLAKMLGYNRSSIYREIRNNSSIQKGKVELFKHDRNHIDCDLRKVFPFVCNTCNKATCSRRRYYYDAYEADLFSKEDLHEHRKVPRIAESELRRIDEVVSSRVLKKQSLYHILKSDESLKLSESTLRRYINHGYLKCRTIDLPRTIRFAYKKQYDHHRKRVDIALLNGRMYRDYISRMKDENHTVIELDTVFGKKTDRQCILTCYEKETKFQWGYLIKQTCASVNAKLETLIKECQKRNNDNLFFDTILMDNGLEFQDVPKLEANENGVINFKSYYCDPYQSGQKGGCERNHEFIRYMYKKGESIASLTQVKLDDLFSQINSLKRRSLKGNSSYELFVSLFGNIIADILNITQIIPSKVSFKK